MLVTLALYHRDTLSRGNSRRIFGYEAYHWGLLLMSSSSSSSSTTAATPPDSPLYSFDATDASDIDPVTFRLRNPSMDWWLRAEAPPAPNPKLIGQLVVGTIAADALPNDTAAEDNEFQRLRAFFQTVPLPVKNTHPQQSCVTWAVAALAEMQTRGWVRPDVDLPAFQDAALAYADARMGENATEPPVKEYFA
ncbi:hypothetical protein ISF_04660 [Cordyceps fumosorosea ARSEF 2679]|uniref:Uncharacterized protein n=1 Tax=Cordyceps fumosorosea (strain ARSEF 2679) TaxID=1081104 RepID=A0A167WLU0_CORFA|nr:hypothetical protein ISF_04660 [Cordyceps fumosorosea ARSEF 2679]OAA63951.1 hypothetical protein ISF_04660 [Cordyceps fumosorosea ARSEF 2679]